MTRAKNKYSKAVRRQTHKAKSYFSLPIFCFWFSVGLNHFRQLPCSEELWVEPGRSFHPAIPIYSPSHLPLPPRAPCQDLCSCAKQMNNHLEHTEEVKCIHLLGVPVSHPDCLFPGHLTVIFWIKRLPEKGPLTWLLPNPFFPLKLTPGADVHLCTVPRETLVVRLQASWPLYKRNPIPLFLAEGCSCTPGFGGSRQDRE